MVSRLACANQTIVPRLARQSAWQRRTCPVGKCAKHMGYPRSASKRSTLRHTRITTAVDAHDVAASSTRFGSSRETPWTEGQPSRFGRKQAFVTDARWGVVY